MAGSAFFLMRLNDHVQYLKKVNATLKGEMDFAGNSHDECKLGAWILNDGPAEVAKLSDPRAQEVFESIKAPHQKFHDVGKMAIAHKKTGEEEQATKLVTEMHKLSTDISNKLLELDKMS